MRRPAVPGRSCCVDQAARIGVLGSAHDRLGGALLHDLAAIEHVDAVDDLADDREVVRDEEVGEPELLLQALEEVEDLRLHRDVERRDGLVADQDFRADGERAGDRDALALAARERRPDAGRR